MISRAHIRNAMGWMVPPKVEGLLGLVWDRMANSAIAANGALRDRHAGERCFVIGNGPSLAKTDLSLLRGQFTIAANSFYKHPQAAELRLSYLCIGDPHFMADTPSCVAWHNLLCEKLPGTAFMLHESARPLIEKRGLYSGRETYFARTGIHTNVLPLANVDFTRALNCGWTTGTLLAIPLALYLGFKQICLLGFDANWLESYTGSYHFYDKHELFPEFDSVAADNRGHRYEDEVHSVLSEYRSHRLLQELATRRGVRLVNGTVGGLLDMHPRVDYRELLR